MYRPSSGIWFIQQSSGGFRFENFGLPNDVPQVADYDNDGRADIGVFRPGGPSGAEWWLLRSSAGIIALQFGLSTDKPVVADYTGDGTADVAFWAAERWLCTFFEAMTELLRVPIWYCGDAPHRVIMMGTEY